MKYKFIWQAQGQTSTAAVKKKPKTNFVEVRSYLHLYRSFDRMWIFFILALQVTLKLGLAVLFSGFLYLKTNVFG